MGMKLTLDSLAELHDRLIRISEKSLLDSDKISALKAAHAIVVDYVKGSADPDAKLSAISLSFAERQKLAKKLVSD